MNRLKRIRDKLRSIGDSDTFKIICSILSIITSLGTTAFVILWVLGKIIISWNG